jgi:hypothetical protein
VLNESGHATRTNLLDPEVNDMIFADKRDKILDLCQKIKMPEAMTTRVLEQLEQYDFAPLSQGIDRLVDPTRNEEGFRLIQDQLKDQPQAQSIWLAAYLIAALQTHHLYQLKGIDDAIYYETMACFTRFVNEHLESYGDYGFDRAFWPHRQTSLRLFRLGTLEFEMVNYSGQDLLLDGAVVLRSGEPILSVHIPGDARLGGENCHASYEQAKTFFARFYPEFLYKEIYTHTWLLSPALRELLPPESNIMNFQKDYAICRVVEKDNGYIVWVYKNPKLSPEDFPEKTALQRAIKRHVLRGGWIGSAAGVVRINQ